MVVLNQPFLLQILSPAMLQVLMYLVAESKTKVVCKEPLFVDENLKFFCSGYHTSTGLNIDM